MINQLIILANTAEAFKKQLLDTAHTPEGKLRLRHEISLSQRAFFWEDDNKVIVTPSPIPQELFDFNCRIMGYKNVENIVLPKESIDLCAEITSNEN